MRVELIDVFIIVERVNPQAELSPLLTNEDLQHLATITAPPRRAQWATWRTIVRQHLGPNATLYYNSNGAPMLAHPVGNISHLNVSHSSTHVAVIFANRPCGVDIEALGRNFGRIASRYIAPCERETFAKSVGPHFEAIMWSVKEALYKYAQATGVDFTKEMVATSHTHGQITFDLWGSEQPPVHYEFYNDQVLSYVVEATKSN